MQRKIAKLKIFEKLRLTELTNIRQELKFVNCNSVFENTEPVRVQKYSRGVKEDDFLNPCSGLAWLHDVRWHKLDCSSGMVVDSSNWLAIGVVGKTNSPSSPRLITLCISWAPVVPAH